MTFTELDGWLVVRGLVLRLGRLGGVYVASLTARGSWAASTRASGGSPSQAIGLVMRLWERENQCPNPEDAA